MITIQELINRLQGYDPDALVVIAGDAEGNTLSPMADETDELYLPYNDWSGERVIPEDDEIDAKKAVVLWPTA